MKSSNADPSKFETSSESQPCVKPLTLLDLGEDAIGFYCDPITGECYPGSEMKHLEKENLMTTAIDPVCKMEVNIETAKYKSEHAGEVYYFCSAACQKSFEEDPHQYLTEDLHGHEGH